MSLPCALHVALQDAWSVLKEEEGGLSREAMDAMMPGTPVLYNPGQSVPQSVQKCPKCAQLQMEVDTLRAKLASMQGGQM